MRTTQRRAWECLMTVVTAVATAWLFCGACERLQGCEGEAEADEPAEVSSLAEGILALVPAMRPEVARSWAARIGAVSAETGVPAPLLAAIVYRESSYRADVARCVVRGARGEMGVMQAMPRGYVLRFAPPDCRDQCDPTCSLATGARYLAHLRRTCAGSTWRWVAAYGRRSCPSEEQAREDRAARRAEALVRTMGGEW